jgi:hypothetical protein
VLVVDLINLSNLLAWCLGIGCRVMAFATSIECEVISKAPHIIRFMTALLCVDITCTSCSVWPCVSLCCLSVLFATCTYTIKFTISIIVPTVFRKIFSKCTLLRYSLQVLDLPCLRVLVVLLSSLLLLLLITQQLRKLLLKLSSPNVIPTNI